MDFHTTSRLLSLGNTTYEKILEAGIELQAPDPINAHEREQEGTQKWTEKQESKSKITRREKIFRPLSEVQHELLTTDELAYYLRLKEQTIRKKRMDGTLGIAPVKIGGRLRWPKHRVIEYLRKLSSLQN